MNAKRLHASLYAVFHPDERFAGFAFSEPDAQRFMRWSRGNPGHSSACSALDALSVSACDCNAQRSAGVRPSESDATEV